MLSWTFCWRMKSSMNNSLYVCVKIHCSAVCFLFECRNKPFKKTSCLLKNTLETINEPKEKRWQRSQAAGQRWTLWRLWLCFFLGAGRQKGPFSREQYVHVLHLLPGRMSRFSTSLFTQSLSVWDDVYFITGYWRWPPKRPGRWPPPDGALVWRVK